MLPALLFSVLNSFFFLFRRSQHRDTDIQAKHYSQSTCVNFFFFVHFVLLASARAAHEREREIHCISRLFNVNKNVVFANDIHLRKTISEFLIAFHFFFYNIFFLRLMRFCRFFRLFSRLYQAKNRPLLNFLASIFKAGEIRNNRNESLCRSHISSGPGLCVVWKTWAVYQIECVK